MDVRRMGGPAESRKPMTDDWSVEDWSRERPRRWWDPSRRLLRSIRRYQRWRARGWSGRLLSRWFVLEHRFWSCVTGADIPLNSRIAGGLLLPHPVGVVIHPWAAIGPNCLIAQNVTIGEGERIPGRPILGAGVDVGAGAVILGGVTIGDRARIGANAVVLTDVPAGATAVGVPARILRVSTVFDASRGDAGALAGGE
jgi:serine O-acetyltransferase